MWLIPNKDPRFINPSSVVRINKAAHGAVLGFLVRVVFIVLISIFSYFYLVFLLLAIIVDKGVHEGRRKEK